MTVVEPRPLNKLLMLLPPLGRSFKLTVECLSWMSVILSMQNEQTWGLISFHFGHSVIALLTEVAPAIS